VHKKKSPRAPRDPAIGAKGKTTAPAPGLFLAPRGGETPFRLGDPLFMASIAAAVLVAYLNVWRAGFIWDDGGHVTRPDLRSLGGLWRIWFKPGSTQQYYPVLHSLFWVEHRLWGDAASGYHLANLVLHSVVAFLLYRVLRRLQVQGAHLAALAFALHPVCVESVAWISEEKNTLSAVFYLMATLAYLRFDESRGRRPYAVASALFVLALLSKSVTATLPAALLVILWWKRGRLSWSRDFLPLLPWFGMAAASGAMTSWMERTYIGARGTVYALGFVDRVLVAGRAVWFYAGKLIWPSKLVFIYPHWSIDDRIVWQYSFPIAALAVLLTLYLIRGATRGPLAAALLFVGTLFPALGFVNVYPFVYSYVADHFQYLSAAIAISAFCAGITFVASRLPMPGRATLKVLAACVVATLAVLTAFQCSMYSDVENLWLTTISRNPGSWMAYRNLGDAYLKDGRVDEAIENYKEAVSIDPSLAESHNDLGVAFIHAGKPEEAIAQFRLVLDKGNANAEAHNNLGNVFAGQQRYAEAVIQYQQSAEIDPSDIGAHYNLGNALMRLGRVNDAIGEYRKTLSLSPDDVDAHYNLGSALLGLGKTDDAISEYRKTLELDPGNAKSHMNLGAIFLQKRLLGEAIAEFKEAIRIDGAYTDARFNLANAYMQASRLDEAIEQFRKILEDNPNDSEAQRDLGLALSRRGGIEDANSKSRETEPTK
jgi:tetratricopeptide (TPR) repeat protein